nr:MAG TPA: hypothetical protein [Caudoviricetes sp.]
MFSSYNINVPSFCFRVVHKVIILRKSEVYC